MTNRVDAARKLRGSGDRLFGNSFGGGFGKSDGYYTRVNQCSIRL